MHNKRRRQNDNNDEERRIKCHPFTDKTGKPNKQHRTNVQQLIPNIELHTENSTYGIVCREVY